MSIQALKERLASGLMKSEMVSLGQSRFIARAGYEIRNPLNGIIGMSALLLNTELDEDQLECAEFITMCAYELLDIVNCFEELIHQDVLSTKE
ncbi:osomolarity two-component system sensor histidine kinase NIK1 [Desulfobotulus alkaliphilus]|uniref:histidine kinase n=1 Tax=Desulfobotulus alkaliphilus TaxID=622671 RepID=A0A562RWX7_9BACT|nr:histidine kinase dimerization/phospho-acceptor domain-containing protein [Desulfobotulus alkaliphilus]TWI72994.1 osomolarity two-component system sensor histidine kinase NIK1 [Desulfobotulus alkaliphilus]